MDDFTDTSTSSSMYSSDVLRREHSTYTNLSEEFRKLKLKLTGEGSSDDDRDRTGSSPWGSSVWFAKAIEEELAAQNHQSDPATPAKPTAIACLEPSLDLRNPLLKIQDPNITRPDAAQPSTTSNPRKRRRPNLTIDTELASPGNFSRATAYGPRGSPSPDDDDDDGAFDIDAFLQRPFEPENDIGPPPPPPAPARPSPVLEAVMLRAIRLPSGARGPSLPGGTPGGWVRREVAGSCGDSLAKLGGGPGRPR